MKKKNIVVSLLLVLGLLSITLGVSIAFFNYTKTGAINNIGTGRIVFNSEQSGVLNLTNIFPMTHEEASSKELDSVSVIITGDTTYANGEEYLISFDELNNILRKKRIPINYFATYNAVTGKTIGTEDEDYFENRGGNTSIYKLESDGYVEEDVPILTGYISSGATGINGVLTIKAYVDADRIAISDTYPARGSGYVFNNNMTSTEYANCLALFREFEYTDEEAETLCNNERLNGDSIQDLLDYDALYSDEIESLEENNVIFYADYSDGTTKDWVDGRVVFRTKEWNSFGSEPISFKLKAESNEGIWVDKPLSALGIIKQNVDRETIINFGNKSSDSNGKGVYILPGTENDTYPIYYYRGEIDNNNVIFGGFCWQIVRTTDTGGIKMVYNGETTDSGATCINKYYDQRIIATNVFNIDHDIISDVGYMYNQLYTTYSSLYNLTPDTNIFGKSVEWDGTNYLVIDDNSGVASTNTTLDPEHHYSCDNPSSTTCTTVRYHIDYEENSSVIKSRYIYLTNGEKIEDALYKMTGNGSDEIKARNSNYKLNSIDSTAKTIIENWFEDNLINYMDYLEDTIWCNDRTYKTVEGNTYKPTYQNSSWNPNGTSLKENFYFGTSNRVYNYWFSTTNVPSLACPNETDRFSMSNNKAKIKYPIGLLTADEMTLAGASNNDPNRKYYLYTGHENWSMSPANNYHGGSVYVMDYSGIFFEMHMAFESDYRPAISLKSGTEFIKGGDGTETNPYVVNYN